MQSQFLAEFLKIINHTNEASGGKHAEGFHAASYFFAAELQYVLSITVQSKCMQIWLQFNQFAISHRTNYRIHFKTSVEESLECHSLINSVLFQIWRSCFKYTEFLKVVLLWPRHLKLYLRLLGSFFSPFGHSCFTSKVNIKGKKS